MVCMMWGRASIAVNPLCKHPVHRTTKSCARGKKRSPGC
jgi:hypothetical protein